MKRVKVKELMIPLEEYAVVSDDATLYEAVTALEDAQRRFYLQRFRSGADTDQDEADGFVNRGHGYQHRAILVKDKGGNIVGKLSQLDVLRGLETGYNRIGDLTLSSRSGLNPEFVKSLLKQYSLFQDPLDHICSKANNIKVRDVMYTPTEGEYVKEDDTLDQAIHQLVMGHHQSLLVTESKKGAKIVGILRLVDVFSEVCNAMKACKI